MWLYLAAPCGEPAEVEGREKPIQHRWSLYKLKRDLHTSVFFSAVSLGLIISAHMDSRVVLTTGGIESSLKVNSMIDTVCKRFKVSYCNQLTCA